MATAQTPRRASGGRTADRERDPCLHAEHQSAYGAPRVHAELRARGRRSNRKRVTRLMRINHIVGRHLHKKKRTSRSQPVLPLMPGVPERRSHDYVRAGTTTLFAALEVATGKVIGSLHRRHRAAEFKKFLARLDNEVPADLGVHLILDNYATHKTPAAATASLTQVARGS
ncbi:IS3 family transposase [Streptomyces auratus AGR0001]|uniref:IS3 family transposase n=1 Tax=Streptomyces auratus AGR0001 TaxID=1160718 RepID=A0A8B1NPK2_9ACTN|nr:IS3 family transposase [Streptomyces auratus AGR0001]